MSDQNNETCEGCALASRRDFLRDSALIAAGVMASLGGARPVGATTTNWIDNIAASNGNVTYPIPVANGVSIDRKTEVVLTRWNGVIYAFSLACPHQKTALRWIEGDSRFQCPKHKSKYQPDGTFISGKATRGMDRFSLVRDGANVVVDTNAMHKQDVDPAGWTAAMVRVADGEK